jgi:DHA3 family tetracycline resistance protein-like MFS transporter
MAVAGPLSKVVPVQLIFAAAGTVPIVLAAVALAAARMPRDEIAHPLGGTEAAYDVSTTRY